MLEIERRIIEADGVNLGRCNFVSRKLQEPSLDVRVRGLPVNFIGYRMPIKTPRQAHGLTNVSHYWRLICGHIRARQQKINSGAVWDGFVIPGITIRGSPSGIYKPFREFEALMFFSGHEKLLCGSANNYLHVFGN